MMAGGLEIGPAGGANRLLLPRRRRNLDILAAVRHNPSPTKECRVWGAASSAIRNRAPEMRVHCMRSF